MSDMRMFAFDIGYNEDKTYPLPWHYNGFLTYTKVFDPGSSEHKVFVGLGNCVSVHKTMS